jgi:hypothetical protein
MEPKYFGYATHDTLCHHSVAHKMIDRHCHRQAVLWIAEGNGTPDTGVAEGACRQTYRQTCIALFFGVGTFCWTGRGCSAV